MLMHTRDREREREKERGEGGRERDMSVSSIRFSHSFPLPPHSALNFVISSAPTQHLYFRAPLPSLQKTLSIFFVCFPYPSGRVTSPDPHHPTAHTRPWVTLALPSRSPYCLALLPSPLCPRCSLLPSIHSSLLSFHPLALPPLFSPSLHFCFAPLLPFPPPFPNRGGKSRKSLHQ